MNGRTNDMHGKTPVYDPSALPQFCDYSCEHARFASEDAVGACRRELGVLCTILNAYVNKNAKCQVRKQGGENS